MLGQRSCHQQQRWMQHLSAHAAHFWLSGKPCACNIGPVIWQERVSSIWLSPGSRRTSKWPSQLEKLETSNLAKLEASERCGGTQRLGDGSRWGRLGASKPSANAAAYFPGTPALGCVCVFVTLPWQPARSHSPSGNTLWYQWPFGCCLEFPYCFSVSSSGFSAVSLKTQNDTLLHHHVLLCLCLGQRRQAPLKGEGTGRAVWGLCNLQKPHLSTRTPLCYAMYAEQKEPKQQAGRPKGI